MKKIIEKECWFCDKCGKDQFWSMASCRSCKIDLCSDCMEKFGKQYHRSMSFLGNGDALYCNACDVKLSDTGTDQLYNAFVKLEALRKQYLEFDEEIKKRADPIKQEIRELTGL